VWGENRGVYGDFLEKPEGKRPLGKPRRKWEDNIKMDLQEGECEGRTESVSRRIGTGVGHF
jgi:hypothetical protein